MAGTFKNTFGNNRRSYFLGEFSIHFGPTMVSLAPLPETAVQPFISLPRMEDHAVTAEETRKVASHENNVLESPLQRSAPVSSLLSASPSPKRPSDGVITKNERMLSLSSASTDTTILSNGSGYRPEGISHRDEEYDSLILSGMEKSSQVDSIVGDHSTYIWRNRIQSQNLVDRSKEEEILRQYVGINASEECKDNTTGRRRRCASFIYISGPSGTGKSNLACSLECLPNQNYCFLSGKFDVRPQLQPYAAIVAAFQNFSHVVMEQGTTDRIKKAIASAVTPEGAALLLSLMPSLEPLLSQCDVCNEGKAKKNASCTKELASSACTRNGGVQGFLMVFRSFLRAVCSLDHPIILLVDDLHRADPCSLDALRSIVMERHEGLTVIATSENDSFWNSLTTGADAAHETDGSFVSIALTNVTADIVREAVDKIFESTDEAQIVALGDLIYQQTEGNLRYMKEFVLWLQFEDLISHSSDGSWEWDVDEIRLQYHTPSPFKKFLTQQYQKYLFAGSKDFMNVAVCLGSHCLNSKLIQYVLDHPIDEHMHDCVRHSMLEQRYCGGLFFAHDTVQEAVYNLMSEAERERFHVEVGRRLWRKLDQDELDRHLFLVLSQFQVGKRLITREKERINLSKLCLHAASKAAKTTSNFSTAAACLELGIYLMGERGWREDYNLTLALHNAGAEMQMCMADLPRMESLVDNVELHARSQIDKVQALGTRMYSLGVTDRQSEAIDLGITVLKSIGERFPTRFYALCIAKSLIRVRRLLGGKSNEQLMRLPPLECPQLQARLHFLQLMFLDCLLTRPELGALIALKIMSITLKNGMSEVGILGFALYGIVSLGIFNNLDDAYRFGKLSVDLLDMYGATEYMPRAYAAFYGVIYPWKDKITDTREPLLRAHRLGLQTGDLAFGYLCSNCYMFHAYHSGTPLGVIMKQWNAIRETMMSNEQKTIIKMSLPLVQCILFLTDTNLDPLSFKGEEMDFIWEIDEAEKTNCTTDALELRTICGKIAYTFGAYELADEYLREFGYCGAVPVFGITHTEFTTALVAATMVKRGKNRGRNIRLIRQIIRKFKRWTSKSPHNCLARMFMLEAELASVSGRPEEAYPKYVCAIATAKDAECWPEIALANELCGKHLTALQRESTAKPFFVEAVAAYDQWGAKAKALHLKEEMHKLLHMCGCPKKNG